MCGFFFFFKILDSFLFFLFGSSNFFRLQDTCEQIYLKDFVFGHAHAVVNILWREVHLSVIASYRCGIDKVQQQPTCIY